MITTKRGERGEEDKEWELVDLPPDVEKAIRDYLEGLENHSPHLDCLWGELYGAINANFWGGYFTAEQAHLLRRRYLFDYGDEDGLY